MRWCAILLKDETVGRQLTSIAQQPVST